MKIHQARPRPLGGHEPVVHVALATYNGEPWVGRQIQTILDQRDVLVRLVVSDDGSTDDTLRTVRRMAARDRRVTVLPPREGEAGVAANFLYALAHLDVEPGQYAAFADQDDVWQPQKLAQQIQFMHEAHADAVSSNVLAFEVGADGGVRRTLIRKDQPQVEWDYLFEAPGAGSTFVLDYAAWKLVVDYVRHRGAEGVAVHDWFVYVILRAAGLPWAIDPRPHVAYRQHGRNVVGAHKGLRAIADRWELLRSGHYRRQFRLMAEVAGRVARETGRSADVLGQLEAWHRRLGDTSPAGRMAVARRARQMRRRPSEQVSLAAACLLGVW